MRTFVASGIQEGLTVGYTGGGVVLALMMLWRFQRSFISTASKKMNALEEDLELAQWRVDFLLTQLRKNGISVSDEVWDLEVPPKKSQK